MAQDPFSVFDDLDDAIGLALDAQPRPSAVELALFASEPEEVTVRDSEGRVIGVIDLS